MSNFLFGVSFASSIFIVIANIPPADDADCLMRSEQDICLVYQHYVPIPKEKPKDIPDAD